jgi:hypothetical protein
MSEGEFSVVEFDIDGTLHMGPDDTFEMRTRCLSVSEYFAAVQEDRCALRAIAIRGQDRGPEAKVLRSLRRCAGLRGSGSAGRPAFARTGLVAERLGAAACNPRLCGAGRLSPEDIGVAG